MKAVSGCLNVTVDPVTVRPVSAGDAYFGIAETLLPGARVLAGATEVPGTALALVAGHILECLLKAGLSASGVSDKELKRLRHGLRELWRQAAKHGCVSSQPMPSWAERLAALHDAPYPLRYPVGLNGLILPGAHPMLTELSELHESVRRRRE